MKTSRHTSDAVVGWAALSMLVAASPQIRADELYVPQQYFTIQEAIDAAEASDEVIVAPGRYREVIDFHGKAITVRGSDGADVTTIDGRWFGSSVVTFASGETNASILEGFTITQGAGTFYGIGMVGGGAFILDSSPVIRSCVFLENVLRDDFGNRGGAIAVQGSSEPLISHCRFDRNEAYEGGAVSIFFGGRTTLQDCTFEENEATFGGGLSVVRAEADIERCVFQNQFATQAGGAEIESESIVNFNACSFIDNAGGLVAGGLSIDRDVVYRISNCLFAGNSGGNGYGAVATHSNGLFVNCTFVDNDGDWRAGAIWGGRCVIDIQNCVLYENRPNQLQAGYPDTVFQVTFSNIEDGWDGEGNIDADPAFASPATRDYRLTSGSPCIDAGDTFLVPSDLHLDLAGQPRVVDDAGKYDTGRGDPDVVDLGALEYQKQSEFALTVQPLPVPPDSTLDIRVTNATPNGRVWVAYSVTGLGSTPIEPLNVTLDLDAPVQISTSKRAGPGGAAAWLQLPTPANPQPVWFQAVQSRRVSNVVATRLGQ